MIFIPISDDNDEGYTRFRDHFINNGLLLLCIVVFAYEAFLSISQGSDSLHSFIHSNTFNPAFSLGTSFLSLSPMDRVMALFRHLADIKNADILNILKSTFIHGGLLHLLPNIFVLWMLGDNVEYAMGHVRYFFFFMLTAILSQFGQLVFSTGDNFISQIGASGAIMAVAGAYLVYFPRARINFFYWFFLIYWGIKDISARIVLLLYFILLLLIALAGDGTVDGTVVATWAHVFGFVAGAILSLPLRYGRDDKYFQYTRAKSLSYNKSLFKTGDDDPDPWGKAL